MSKMKRAIFNSLILILGIILLGCRDIDLRSSTVINENGSGVVKLQVVYDDFISTKLKNDVIDHEWAKENGYNFNKYFENNMNIEEITYEFKDIKELEEKINSSGLATMTNLKRRKGKEDIYTIDVKFNKSAIDNLIQNNTNDEKVYNYIKNIKFINEVEVPGNIIGCNAEEDADENTRVWTYKMSEIDDNTKVDLSYRIKNHAFPISILPK
ncbi:hypothetical protein [Clostridium beijerinckii]|uniref:hypothetical protein n=1 Tax=Clostridium beijerinckii TaxID=1520 RepID=UPI00047BDA13|nr:hypothetical protein [Clostridium beijerinckii]